MAWIESHTVLIRHRKLLSIARELRLKPVYMLGHFHALWHAALEQQEDGDLSSWSDELIAELAAYHGNAPQFVSLLQQSGWLDGKIIHDWWDYAGRYLTKKYQTSNPDRLKAIRDNLERAGKSIGYKSKIELESLKSPLRVPTESPPNLTYLPNQPNLKPFCLTSDEVRLSELLFNFILKRNPEYKKPNLTAWAVEINKMFKLDNRNLEDIEKVINWCQNDIFWQNNILSTKKLRQKYDQLLLKMQQKGGKNGNSSGIGTCGGDTSRFNNTAEKPDGNQDGD